MSPLQSGAPKGISYAARLSRPEFERRYAADPQIKKAELIEGIVYVEIAASSAAIDTGSKERVYRRNEVLEYIIWQSYGNQLEWFGLENGDYQLLSPDPDGIIRSRVFPGLWLAVEALLGNQMMRVLEVLQAGLQSPEHQAFVERLGKG